MSKAVAVRISDIILGRELNLPIHDTKGLLLLAAGAKFTAEVKQKLLERGITYVVLDECDASNMTLASRPSGEVAALARLDTQLNERLETLIRSGAMTVRNSGPPLLQRVIQHGRKNYDAETRQQLASQQQAATQAVETMMADVAEGRELNGGGVNQLAGSCAEGLVIDIGNTLSVSFQQNQDSTIEKHAVSVALLGMAIGIEMGLDIDNVQTIGMAGLVQDLGMTRIPSDIRKAHRPLSPIEFLEVQKHPIWTANILERTNGLPKIVQLVAYQTHERPDGSGYPRKRERKSIHLFARILHVADAYTAMTAERPHRAPMMAYAAIETLLRQARRGQVDPQVVRAMLNVVSLFPIGSFVTLSDGSVAQVLRSNGANFTKPVVLRVQDGQGQPVPSDSDAALVDLTQADLSVVQALPTPGREEIGLPEMKAEEAGLPKPSAALTGPAGLMSRGRDALTRQPVLKE